MIRPISFFLLCVIFCMFQESSVDTFVDEDKKKEMVENARIELETLVDALRRIGIDAIELDISDEEPDGVFINDIAVVINKRAFICNPRPERKKQVNMK